MALVARPLSSPNTNASPKTKTITRRGVKPRTFKTAISLRLSRTLKLMALAITMVMLTMLPGARIHLMNQINPV